MVSFTTPTAGALLCPSTGSAPGCIDDTDASTPGWQGNLTVHVTASGANVVGSVITFTNGATTFPTATTDANGDATLSGVTIPEGTQTILATTDNIPGAGVGSGSVAVTVDTLAPNVPTGLLNATIPTIDPTARRKMSMQLSWTAPSDAGGGSVTGYQVRYSKKPIVTQADFDAATKYPYTTQPANPGDPDGISSVTPLYIENDYYFAVEATDIAGTPSPMLTSASPGTGQTCDCTSGRCCAAHFNTTTLSGSTGSTTEGTGFAMDGSGDADGDGLSDVLIGSFNNSRAYLFLGSSNFAPTAASVVFTGAAAGFGRGVAFIGDIDHDGREDLAIANRATNVVYIYRGRATWPMTMADTDADFTITADVSYASSLFGSSMTRLGDFDGDGVDDFAIGAPNFTPSGDIGRVTVILGSAGFTSLALPSPTRAIIIDGESTLTFGAFGAHVIGIGSFFSPSGGTELIVSAPGFVGAPSGTQGKVYAFRAQAAVAGVIPVASADATSTGAAAGMRIGSALTDLGIVGSGPPNVAIGNPNDSSVPGATGSVYLFSGDTTNGPFSSVKTLYFSTTSLSPFALIGGGVPGRRVSVSTIGDSSPDVVVVPRNGNKIGIIDGGKISTLANLADVLSAADVIVGLPAGVSAPTGGSLVLDVNGDGFADFAVSDGASTDAGNTVILW